MYLVNQQVSEHNLFKLLIRAEKKKEETIENHKPGYSVVAEEEEEKLTRRTNAQSKIEPIAFFILRNSLLLKATHT